MGFDRIGRRVERRGRPAGGALLADFADVNLVTGISGLVDASPLFFRSHSIQIRLQSDQQDHIRYIVVDRRLASSLPLFGTYFEPGEAKPGTAPHCRRASKFDSVPDVDRVDDNGPIQVYDVTRLLGMHRCRRRTWARANGNQTRVLAAAIAVATVGFVACVGVEVGLGLPTGSSSRCIVGSMVLRHWSWRRPWSPIDVAPTVIGLGGTGTTAGDHRRRTRSGPPSGAVPSMADLRSPLTTGTRCGRVSGHTASSGSLLLVAGIIFALRVDIEAIGSSGSVLSDPSEHSEAAHRVRSCLGTLSAPAFCSTRKVSSLLGRSDHFPRLGPQ